MRRRAVRDLVTVLGVVVILGGVVFANTQMFRTSDKERYDKARSEIEAERSTEGIDILPWDLLKKTKGGKGSVPKYAEEVEALADKAVNLIGFMVPLYQTSEMTEFMVLPVPIQCYFCDSPPLREVMLVTVAEGNPAEYVEEPLLISGVLHLNAVKGARFLYSIDEAQWGAASKTGKLSRKEMKQQHLMHVLQEKMKQQGITEEVVEGIEEAPPVSGEATGQSQPASPSP